MLGCFLLCCIQYIILLEYCVTTLTTFGGKISRRKKERRSFLKICHKSVLSSTRVHLFVTYLCTCQQYNVHRNLIRGGFN